MPNQKYEDAYKALGNDKVAKLKLATILGDSDYIKDLIKAGVNPFASTKALVNGDSLPPISIAISTNDLAATSYFLKHAKKPFDFRQRHPSYSEKALTPMSWIQFAALSSRNMSELIKAYQMKHFAETDYSLEINKVFSFSYTLPENGIAPRNGTVRKNGTLPARVTIHTNIASLLFWMLTPNYLLTNLIFVGDKKAAGAFVSKWQELSDLEKLTVQFPQKTAFSMSALHQLEFLSDNGLNLKLQDHNNKTPTQNARLFFEASKNPKIWETQIRPYLILNGVTQIGAADQHGADILLTLRVKNPLGAHEIEAFGIPVYDRMRLLVDPEFAISEGKAAPVLFSLQNQVSQQETRLTKVEHDVQELQADFAQLSEVQFNKACKGLAKYPFHCALFKKLHKAIESLIRQKGDASLQVFPAMPSSERMFAAEVVLGVFNVGASLAPVPYLQVIPGIASAALACWNKHATVKESNAVFSLELNSNIMATLISSRIVAGCMETYGMHPVTKATVTAQNAHTAVILDLEQVTGALFGKVKKQVNNLSKHKFAEPLEAVVFMCDSSLEHLQSVKEGLHTHSHGSSDSPKFAQVSDSDSFGSHGSNKTSKHSSNDDVGVGVARIGDKQPTAKPKKSLLKRMGCPIQ